MFLKIFKSFLVVVIVTTLITLPIMAEQPDFDLNSKSAILMEYETGEIIFEKNPHMKLPPASMTKIMTMLLAVEAIEQGRAELADKLVVSEFAASMGGSQIWLEPGEEMTLEEMLRAIAIVSANDACVAVAEYLYGTEEAFVKRMNERARELGLKNTYYYNTNGLPADNEEIQGNYTTAYDLAVLAREILKYPEVLKWTSTWIDYLRDGSSVLNNTNRLVRHYLGADGLKTGYTEEAKFCLTSTARRDSIRFIAVVMAADDSKTRFAEAAELLSFGFGTYQGYEVAVKDEFIAEVKIPNGKEETARGIIKEELIVPVKKGNEDSIRKEVFLDELIRAPLNKGDKIGELRAYKGNLLLKSSDIILDRDVEKAGIFQLVLRIITRIIQLIINLF
ncbi:MAG: D-alanyl-D-alanine carboxypeptidase [Firmicutes bacterium]|nr:D-alanyl-D-alanine carboxypeptidase [Bacillota bacterium]